MSRSGIPHFDFLGELPPSLADFFRSGVDRGLTGGEDGSGDPDDALFRA